MINKVSKARLILLPFYFFYIFSINVLADQNNEIRVGMSVPLTGPLKEIGNAMYAGVDAYFSRINEQKGLNRKYIRLIVKDDGYEPERAAANMHQLIDRDEVVAIIGNVGTPTATVTVPIANSKKILFFGAMTGADFLRQKMPVNYIYNYRPSYAQEAATMVEYLLMAGIKPKEIAFFTQNDAYGDAGFNGAVKELIKIGFTDIYRLAHGRYKRNTLNVESALATLIESETKPRAVIMAGSYEPTAKFIKLARAEFPNLVFMNLSFVGGHALMKNLGDEAENIIITQVVPHYASSQLPITHDYLDDMSKYNNLNPGFISFEGYIVAKIFTESLKSIDGEINRLNLLQSIRNIKNLDIGMGELINFDSEKNQAMDKVWPMVINEGQLQELKWQKLGDILNAH